MAVSYTKTKLTEYNASQMQSVINSSALIVPSCLGITGGDPGADNLEVEFAASLSTGEEAELDSIITAHTPTVSEISVTKLPFSDLDDGFGDRKLAVHPSYKPSVANGTTYAVWTGAGDDVVSNPSKLGAGELLHFDPQTGTPIVSKDIKFDHALFGRVWVHEAYLKFDGGGEGDYISADVVASATAAQQAANLDLVLDGDNLKYAPGGPGTGTHGFAATPTLIPRTFSMDGDWDYNGISLTPNMAGTGEYRICIVDTPVHRYVNKIPCYGSCPTYFSMSSDETAELLPGYFLQVRCHNVSNTDWHASVIMEIYRERTVDP